MAPIVFPEVREMRVTLTAIKADVGSIGGHLRPSGELLDAVRRVVREGGKGRVIDFAITQHDIDAII